MEHQFSRTELLIGKAGVEKLAQSKVAIFGLAAWAPSAVKLWLAVALATWCSWT